MPDLLVPPAFDTVIQKFERSGTPFMEHDVHREFAKARQALDNPSEPENFGAWAEALAFALTVSRPGYSPWGTYFAPMGSGTDKDGNTVYFPDIAHADAQVIGHWSRRARTVTHPVLKARYADLVWDLGHVITKNPRRDPEMARISIDAYLASVPVAIRHNNHDRFMAALRALDLAIMIRDAARTEAARAALLQLHHEAVEARAPLWWLAIDRLIDEKNAGVTDPERQQLVADLEELVRHFGDTTDPQRFNPHVLEDAAKRLIRHYTRANSRADVQRLHEAIGRAFEHFAGLGDALLASTVLQTSVNAYRQAGLTADADRVRIVMESKIGDARAQMAPIETEFTIPREKMEEFLKTVVLDDPGATFVRIAAEFLPNRRQLEEEVRKSLEDSPLMAHMPFEIMADDHVAAKVGTVEDDPFGRLVHHSSMSAGIGDIWLQAALRRAAETHGLTPEHFAAWANRHGLFEDVTFLIEGVKAWFDGDLNSALHLLVPQVEAGLRGMVAQLGKPVTKPHGTVAGVSVAIGMGDIVYSPELAEALGPDLTLHFLAFYAEPRGMNLRNRVAHGLIKPHSISGHMLRVVIHTLLVFGVWKELAERRR